MRRSYTNVVFADELEPILERNEAFMQACFARALDNLTHGTPVDPKSIEGVIAKFMKQRLQKTTAGNRRLFAARTEIPAIAAATFAKVNAGITTKPLAYAPLKGIDLRTAGPNLAKFINKGSQTLYSDLTLALQTPQSVDRNALVQLLKSNRTRILERKSFEGVLFKTTALGQDDGTPPPGNNQAPHPWTTVDLVITKVKCIDPVDEFFIDFGTDVIRVGGKAVSSSADGKTMEINVNQKDVDEFTQKHRVHNPDIRFARFNLKEFAWGPGARSFWAFVTLAEKDVDGGFLDFLKELWELLDEAVIKAVSELIVQSMVAGGVIGGTTGIAEGPAGVVIGALVGATIGLITGAIFTALQDDIFEPIFLVAETLESDTSYFRNGKSKSPTYSDEITREGARYKIWYQYQLK